MDEVGQADRFKFRPDLMQSKTNLTTLTRCKGEAGESMAKYYIAT